MRGPADCSPIAQPLRTMTVTRLAIPILTVMGLLSAGLIPALAEQKKLIQDTRFCPSWAEAHERTLASLNDGRPPYPVHWKGCIVLKHGTRVDIVGRQESSTEIVVRGKHWFTDE
jgi:hypothetical protein